MLIARTLPHRTRVQADTPMDTALTDTYAGGGAHVDKLAHTEICRGHIVVTHRDMCGQQTHMLSWAEIPWTFPNTTNNNIA